MTSCVLAVAMVVFRRAVAVAPVTEQRRYAESLSARESGCNLSQYALSNKIRTPLSRSRATGGACQPLSSRNARIERVVASLRTADPRDLHLGQTSLAQHREAGQALV